ncbi:MAG TPA: site-specific DNA-methyltransferase [Ktedonobacterales bacterium]|nr:site-specific DNA-methyltransferase [Ktedonobacterales bacterium]
MALAVQQLPIQEDALQTFFEQSDRRFCLVQGDSADMLATFPTHSVDACLTSPPYWAQRKYDGVSTLGAESRVDDYVRRLVQIFHELKRVLKPAGSFWLNLGDTYQKKNLSGVPWRVALTLQEDGWILRNAIVWDKVKGNPCNAKDKLRNVYEYLFHFVQRSAYYYDIDAIRTPPAQPTYHDGRVVTPTGVSGAKYERQIRQSKELSDAEKAAALAALAETLRRVEDGDISDFRMIIRGTQRSTHSNDPEFSGRAQELRAKGFCILPYHKNGPKPGDVWRIIPEDEWRKDNHYAVFPLELCETPIKATCPEGGILLDPFVGSGSALAAALLLGRRGIGIDTSATYLATACSRLQTIETQQWQATLQRRLFD